MKRRWGKGFWVGFLIIAIPFVAFLSWAGYNTYYYLNPVPALIPLTNYCIDDADVSTRIDLLMAEVIDSDNIEFKYGWTARVSENSKLGRMVTEAEKSRSGVFSSLIQEYGVQFNARKGGTDRSEIGNLYAYLDDETCTVMHYVLKW